MDPRCVYAPKKAKKNWDAKQSRSPPVLTGLLVWPTFGTFENIEMNLKLYSGV